MSHRSHRTLLVAIWSICLTLIASSACSRSEKAKAAGITQATYTSPEKAGAALISAAKSGDQNTILVIFGQDSKDIIYSGDAAQDKESFNAFVSAYQVMNRWRTLDANTEILLIGADNFAFPIPLRKNAARRWYFDTASGRDEILARRIGRNELFAISVCGALADAQNEYFSQRHHGARNEQYALKFISDTGKQNGLYWESAEGKARSPLGPLVAFATGEGYSVQPNSHQPFHGYYFRILFRQGDHARGGAKDYLLNGKMVNGFAFVAFPAEYGNSGIMTFVVNHDHVVFQKDLGPDTSEIANAMTEYDPDNTWTLVD